MRRKLNFEEIFEQRPTVEQLNDAQRTPVITLIEDIRSMHNVGSIFRTSDGMRIEKLLLSGYTPTPPRPEINKTALGATESVPWAYVEDAVAEVQKLKQQGYTIYIVEQTTDSQMYTEVAYRFPLCLIMGNEVNGVNEKLVAKADAAIELPMLGVKHSLNVSVAYGIALYHLVGSKK